MIRTLVAILLFYAFDLPAQTTMGAEQMIARADSLLAGEKVDDAIAFYIQALGLSQKADLPLQTLAAYNKLGHAYLKQSKFDLALEVLNKAKDFPSAAAHPDIHNKTNNLLGALYEAIGNYDEAYKHLLQSLNISENLKDTLSITESLYKIGNLYYSQKQYTKSLDYYEQVYDISKQCTSIPERVMFLSLSALGSTYEEMNQQEKSLQYNMRSLEVAQQTGNDKNITYALLNIGENYTNLEKYDLAADYLNRALQLSEQLNAPRSKILCLLRLGELKVKTRRYNEAIRFLNSAYRLSKETGSNSLLMDVANSLSAAYEKKGDYQAANSFLREYVALKDSIISESSVNEINRLHTLYEVGKKENAIQLLEQEKQLAEIKRKGTQRTAAGLLIFLGLLAVLLFRVSRLARQQRESNRVLQALNSQIESQNLQLQSYNEELRQYAYVASHDLQEPLRTIGSFVDIIKRRYTDQLDEQAQQYMDYITNGVARLQLLLKDLLAYTRLERENADFVKVKTKEVVKEVIGSLHQIIQDSGARIDFDEDSMPMVLGNHSRLGQVFQNLISNGIKFRGEQPPVIEVGCMPDTHKKEYLFYVKDNGIGIPEEFRLKMFEMFTRLHSRDAYEGSGIGLATCRKIVEKHGGKIWAESEPGMGSAIFFTMPFIQ